MSHGLTGQDRKRLKRYATTQGKDHCRKLEPEDCADIRRRYLDGERLDSIHAEYEACLDTLQQHVRGDCECIHDVDAVSTTGGNPSQIQCPHGRCQAAYQTYDNLSGHINCAHTD